ncbi:MAG: DUF1223 domain-containing protein, partial [Alphaproteobacteria bacterium]|nr:DUF1223 domain-containing protein [Alphaproteobacteria bacterium]
MPFTRRAYMTLGIVACAAGAGAFYIATAGYAPDRSRVASVSAPTPDDGLKVVELFTSQACISCPPAEAFLAELITQRRDVLGLEFHITYWDDFVDGPRGSWKDPFSDPAFTVRQTFYNARLREGAGIY